MLMIMGIGTMVTTRKTTNFTLYLMPLLHIMKKMSLREVRNQL
jgi:hypothetical protein